MTMDKKNGSNRSSRSWFWTNERHLDFLNSMEASFVRAMFEKDDPPSDLRLDRQIPDSCESTQDLRKDKRSRYSTSGSDMKESSYKKSRRLLSNDQVVPQLEIRKDNKDEKDHATE